MSGLYHFVIITVSMTVLIGQIYSKPYLNTTESDVVPFKPLNVDLFDVINKNIFNESNSQVVDLTSIIKEKNLSDSRSRVIHDPYDFVFPQETINDNSSDTIGMNMTLETKNNCENETIIMIPNRVIFEAPEHCGPGYVKDTKGRCRKLIKGRVGDDSVEDENEDDEQQMTKCDS